MVLIAFLVLSTYGIFFSYGVFFRPMMTDLGWSRAETSFAFTIYMVVYTFCSIPMGWLFDRYGPRLPLYLAAVLIGIGFSLGSVVNHLWQLWLFFGIIGGVGFGAIYVVPVSNIVMWFQQKRGLAVGLTVAGIGGGIAAIPPVAESLVSSHGWRTAFVVLGIGYSLLLLAAATFFRKRPADAAAKGPSASAAGNPGGKDGARGNGGQRPDLTVGEALRTRSFWMLYLSMAIAFAAETLALVHVVPFAEDMGMAPGIAAGAVTLVGIGSIVGRVGMGAISDRLGRKSVMAFSYFLEGASLLSLVWVNDTASLYIVMFITGISFGGFSSVFAPLVGEYFGLTHLGKIVAAAFSNGAPAGIIGPLLAGYIFDVSGSYQWAFIASGAMCWIAVACSILIAAEIKKPLPIAYRRAEAYHP